MTPFNMPFAPLPGLEQTDSQQMEIDYLLSGVMQTLDATISGFNQAAFTIMAEAVSHIINAIDKNAKKIDRLIAKVRDKIAEQIVNQTGVVLESTPIISLPPSNGDATPANVTAEIAQPGPETKDAGGISGIGGSNTVPPDGFVCPTGQEAYLVDCKPLPDGSVECIWGCRPVQDGGGNGDVGNGDGTGDGNGTTHCGIGQHLDASSGKCVDNGTGNGDGGGGNGDGNGGGGGGDACCPAEIECICQIATNTKDLTNWYGKFLNDQCQIVDQSSEETHTQSAVAEVGTVAREAFVVASVPVAYGKNLSLFSEAGLKLFNDRACATGKSDPQPVNANVWLQWYNTKELEDRAFNMVVNKTTEDGLKQYISEPQG